MIWGIRMKQIKTFQQALIRIEELEKKQQELDKERKDLKQENQELRKKLEYYENRRSGGRHKHDEKWQASYQDFVLNYESGMSIMEIVNLGEISRRTAYRYKAYYERMNEEKISDSMISSEKS